MEPQRAREGTVHDKILALGAFVGAPADPWIIVADWNATPETAASGWAAKLGAVIIQAPGTDTFDKDAEADMKAASATNELRVATKAAICGEPFANMEREADTNAASGFAVMNEGFAHCHADSDVARKRTTFCELLE